MIILVISGLYPNRVRPHWGIFIHRQTVALAALGHSLRVIAPIAWAPPVMSRLDRWRKYRDVVEREEVDGIRVLRPRVLRPPGDWFLPWEALMMRRCVERAVRRDPPGRVDVVHSHLVMPFGFAAARLARRLGVPLITHARGDDLNLLAERGPRFSSMAREALAASATVVAVSGALAAAAHSQGAKRVSVVRNGIDPCFAPGDGMGERRSLGLPAGARVLCYVGWLMESKGIGCLWRAFSGLARSVGDLHFVAVGSGDGGSWLRAEAERAGLLDRVRLVGALPPEGVARVLRASDVFLFASEREGMPNAVLEAMASGLPVVAMQVGGIAEVISDGENGILVPSGDERTFGRQLRALLEDREEARRIGRNAALSVRELTWERNARTLTTIYEDALADRP